MNNDKTRLTRPRKMVTKVGLQITTKALTDEQYNELMDDITGLIKDLDSVDSVHVGDGYEV